MLRAPLNVGRKGLQVEGPRSLSREAMEEIQERQDDLRDIAESMKQRVEPYNLRYLIFEVSKDRHHAVEKVGGREKAWSDFVDDLPDDECRIALVDVDCKDADGNPTSEIVYVWWNPHSAKVRQRMSYGEKHNADKSHLDGAVLYFHRADDKEALEWETILNIVEDFEES